MGPRETAVYEQGSNSSVSLVDMAIDYILNMWIVQCGIDLINFWISLTIVTSMMIFIGCIFTITPFSIVVMLVCILISLMIIFCSLMPILSILIFPFFIIGSISTYIY